MCTKPPCTAAARSMLQAKQRILTQLHKVHVPRQLLLKYELYNVIMLLHSRARAWRLDLNTILSRTVL